MIIRPAELEDADEIAVVWNRLIRDTLSTFTTAEKSASDVKALVQSRHNAFFVAVLKGQFAGFATFGPFRSGPGYAATVEHTVLVSELNQTVGIGRQLLQAEEKAARDLGHHVMVAGISHTNLAAQAFHQRMGYTEVGRMPRVGFKSEQWLDLVLMQKIL